MQSRTVWITIVLLAVVLLLGIMSPAGLSGWTVAARVDPGAATLQAYTFTGHVYRGQPYDTSTPVAGVTVGVWGDEDEWPEDGEFVRVLLASTATNASGAFSLSWTPGDTFYAYLHVIEEDPPGTYSTGAQPDDQGAGYVKNLNVVSFLDLGAGTYTGIGFWDELPTTATPTTTPTPMCWLLEGWVYQGELGEDPPGSQPLQDVTVAVWGSNNPYPDEGEFLRDTTTNADGWYGLLVCDSDGPYEFYHIIETDLPGYTSAGATSVDGEPQEDPSWIQYEAPLEGKVLTGNKFWDELECPYDDYEPNDRFSQAATIDPEEEHTAYICGSDDEDYFEFYVTAGQEITIDLYGVEDGLPDNYDVELYDPDEGYAEGSYNPDTTSEWIFHTADQTGYWYVYVYGNEGAYSALAPYNLWVTLSAIPTPTPSSTPTATPTPTPTHTPTPTPTGTVPPTHTPTHTPTGTVSPTPTATATTTSTPSTTPTTRVPLDCLDLLTDGSFETGSLEPWGSYGDVQLGPGRESAYGALLGGTDNASGELSLHAILPGADSVWLEYWWLADSETDQPGDFLEVVVQHEGGADLLRTWQAVLPLGQWRYDAINLSAYAGQTVDLTYLVNTDEEVPTTFLVDDVRLKACGEGALPSYGWTFSGTIYLTEDGEENVPARWVQVGLYGSEDPSDLGELLTTTHAGADGAFTLLAYTHTDDYFPFYYLALTDPNYVVVDAAAGPGGEVVGEHWIQFERPTAGDYEENRFDLERSQAELVPIEPPDLIPQYCDGSPPKPDPPPSPPVTDLSVLGIELTQAIQCFDTSKGYTKCPNNSLELTRGKAIAVRVYVGHQGGPACPSNDPVNPVVKDTIVKLTWAASHQASAPGAAWIGKTISQPFKVPCSKTIGALRESIKGSANFYLPASVGKPGWKNSLWVYAEVSAKSVKESNTANNTGEVTRSLYERKPLNVKWIYVYYKPAKSKKYPNDPYKGPVKADFNRAFNAEKNMAAMYPMPVNYGKLGMALLYDSSIKGVNAPDIRDGSEARDVLDKHMDTVYANLTTKPDVLIGWLPYPADGTGTCRGRGGQSVGWVTQCPSNGVWLEQELLSHEVGHCVGLGHPDDTSWEPCWKYSGDNTIKETGFDVSSKSTESATTNDFMAQGSSSGWISPHMWNRLLKKPYTEAWAKVGSGCASAGSSGSGTCDAGTGAAKLGSAITEEQAAILVSGRVPDEGTAELDTLYQFASEGPFPTSNPEGSYCVDLRTMDETTLSSHCFDLEYKQESTGVRSDTGSFSFVLPMPEDARRLVLRHGETTLLERVASPHAPEVSIVAPQGGEVADGTVTISWTASDEDGDTVHCALLYSPDGGESWNPMAFDIEDTSLEVDSTWWAGGENSQIRILASDGFNTTIADSAAFEVPRKAPDAVIFTPENDALLHPHEAIVLDGDADDLEDGELTDTSLTWSSDRQGILGSGRQLILPGLMLEAGEHEITLTATDSDDQMGMATVTVFIGHRVYLPVILKSYL